MRNSNDVFHLAIPCRDIKETIEFYGTIMGCKLSRQYDDRVTFNFFGDQLVCHLSPDKIDKDPNPYPRHFGVTFYEESDFNEMVERLEKHNVDFIQPVNTRFAGKPEVHRTLFFKDPSNNVLEFKYYPNSEMMY